VLIRYHASISLAAQEKFMPNKRKALRICLPFALLRTAFVRTNEFFEEFAEVGEFVALI
jgi:hypothetical protein